MDWKYSRREDKPTREIQISDTLCIGGTHETTLVMAGPCSAESPEQLETVAKVLVSQGVKVLRAGCFKPRTSPYSFFGLGEEGLQMLVDIRNKYGLAIITEARDSTHIDLIIEHADIVQIGAKAMWDYGILRACGRAKKPILLKRSFGAKLKELAQAAEFILNEGNPNVILCERGIRTFESDTRFTLDLCGVAWLKKNCLLPIVLDPSHAMGARYGVPDLTRACVAMGVDGLLIETHPCPEAAKSDAAQQLSLQQFTSLHNSLGSIASAIGKRLI